MRRRHRLTSAKLIQHVFAVGGRGTSSGATCFCVIHGEGGPRVAVVASRRIGGAVVRNRAKRRIRHALDRKVEQVHPGAAVVMVATGRTIELPFQYLVDDVALALDRAGALSDLPHD